MTCRCLWERGGEMSFQESRQEGKGLNTEPTLLGKSLWYEKVRRKN